ncbi:membrane protein insertase YidC [Paenibacillus protaetiae]|uniref:Membrane protein insertase YidC n=1 Tax=Paenibacillus protaetiae TaxID=2509456 RepID=A0A4P6EXW0_9BACL|nr:membrane protein insertase YidC [Paenibacillus protaetiae]QAY67646.1 membrane protein insertase YidC [Paenibacillus protaetiae]
MNKQQSIFKKPKLYAALSALLLLAGCGSKTGTIDANTPGFFNHYVIYPLSYLIQHIAAFFGGNYGIAVIIITLMIRLVLLPLMLRQYRSQQTMRDKMKVMKPELDKLNEKYKGKTDRESAQKKQQEMMQLYGQHQFNPLSMGCLPMIIQIPILSGLYYAIKQTPELAQHSFLWFQLGQKDMILPFLAGAIYYVQFRVSQIGMDSAQQKQMAVMGLLSPVMMAIFSFNAPAAVPLYWVTGGTFMILQTLLSKKIYGEKTPEIHTQSS